MDRILITRLIGVKTNPGLIHIYLFGTCNLSLTWLGMSRAHPCSTLAALARHGVDYSNARTPFPSDSFPGMVGQATGGNPTSTGIYYDDTWNHHVFRLTPRTARAPRRARGPPTSRPSTRIRAPSTRVRALARQANRSDFKRTWVSLRRKRKERPPWGWTGRKTFSPEVIRGRHSEGALAN